MDALGRLLSIAEYFCKPSPTTYYTGRVKKSTHLIFGRQLSSRHVQRFDNTKV
jgi:hypothetical protein